jgi:protocatechuate 3,4-dioxygenase beta subunit
MENDDQQVGRILTRREVLSLFGAAGAMFLVACSPEQSNSAQPTTVATQAPADGPTSVQTQGVAAVGTATMPACVARPELTEGPYFVDEKLNRSDIRSDPSNGSVREGVPLQLMFRVSQISNSCLPLAGATVDVWHCDALGVYSDATDRGFNTKGQKFLRGSQVTDASGTAQFTTVYPGWYQGRAVHIHFKIRTDPNSDSGYEFTSQLFFDESVTDQVHAQAPYASKGQRTLKNEGDGIYRGGGSQLLVSPSKSGQGYATTFEIGLQIT